MVDSIPYFLYEVLKYTLFPEKWYQYGRKFGGQSLLQILLILVY